MGQHRPLLAPLKMIVTSTHVQQASCGLQTDDTMSGIKSKSESLKYSQTLTATCSQGMQIGTLVGSQFTHL